jgi:hypothetical protein
VLLRYFVVFYTLFYLVRLLITKVNHYLKLYLLLTDLYIQIALMQSKSAKERPSANDFFVLASQRP